MVGANMRSKTVLAKRSMSIDLEYGFFRIEEGKTYTDDGTTIFEVYVSDGLANGLFEVANPRANTIIVTHPEARKQMRRRSSRL
jgi:hypothetical protein